MADGACFVSSLCDGSQVPELQRLVSTLTDALHDKDTSLNTQRDMNRRLMERVARLEALVLEKGGAFSGDEDDSDQSGSGRESELSTSGGSKS